MTLDEWRQSKKFTMSKVATLLDTTTKNVSRWCNGEVKPTEEFMQRIQLMTLGMVCPNDFYPVDPTFYER